MVALSSLPREKLLAMAKPTRKDLIRIIEAKKKPQCGGVLPMDDLLDAAIHTIQQNSTEPKLSALIPG